VNFLVIGGTGYMGKILVRLLLDRGDTVTVFSRGTSKPEWWNEVHHIQGDRSDYIDFGQKLKGTPYDAVIDTQAYKREDVESAESTFLDRVDRYLMISTGSVYLEGAVDFSSHCPYDESVVDWANLDYSYPAGEDPYAVGKRHCEKWLLENSRLPYTIVRIPAVMGENDPTGRMWWWVQRALDGQGLIIPTGATGAFRTLYAADAAANFVRILEAPNTVRDIYYVAMPEVMTIERWARLVWQAAGQECRIAYVPREVIAKSRTIANYAPPLSRPVPNIHDLGKAERAFGILSTPVEQWVQNTVDWYRENHGGDDSVGYQFRRDEVSLADRWQSSYLKLVAEF
jgi:nucleoside-diphosphate-sugar epimerase